MTEDWGVQLRTLADAAGILTARARADEEWDLIDSRRAEEVRTAVHALYMEAVGLCIENGVKLAEGNPEDRPEDLMRAYRADADALALAKAHWPRRAVCKAKRKQRW